MKVLIAVDDSGIAENLPRAVETLIRRENAEVLVLHVLQPVQPVPPPEMAQDYAPELDGEMPAASELVERIAGNLGRAGYAAQAKVLVGDVTGAILGKAGEWGADLIIVGSHGQRGTLDFLLGNVAESVARRAECSVLVVRAATSEG
jgi:nucleotide-binding universal stress UspA family protein